MKETVIGVFGGSFSPPHLGHYRALSAFIAQEKPDKTYVFPALIPPHKQLKGDATPNDRMTMCHLAFDALPVCVSDLEIKRGGTSYTVLTLEELKKPDTRILLLCGTDMFLTLDSWYQAKKIFSLAEIVYVARESGEEKASTRKDLAKKAEEYRSRFGATVRELSCDAISVSSTELREMLAKGKNTENYLSPEVKEYIAKWQLYR